ncbi:hypothetical protein [Haloechinothrix halophila]|uniref:hypothetical protein n=1 Tax=Haloechinothrix halophila TaxID=1069073 RepID=UPI000554A3A1|nr:hypothetical protein [Haloechinothrix halophila]
MVRIDGYLANTSAAVGEVEDIAFDADGIQRIIDDTNDLIQRELYRARRDAELYFQNMLKPPDHPAGDQFVSFAREHAERYLEFNRSYIDALSDFVRKLEKLRADYLNREEDLQWGFDKGVKH